MTRRGLVYSILSLLILVSGVAFIEIWAEQTFTAVGFVPRYREKILTSPPDVIFVGNSVLHENLPKGEMEAGLSRMLGRKINVMYIAKGGMHSAWYYLILKNQIATTGLSNIPIFFLDYEDFFIRPEAKTSTGGKSERLLRQALTGDDEVFLRKVGDRGNYFLSGFPYVYSQRFNIKRRLTARFVRSGFRLMGIDRKIKTRRWKTDDETAVAWLLGNVFKGSNFRQGQEVDDRHTADRPAITYANDAEFEQKMESTFVPDMLKFQDRFKLIFVQSNSNPSMVQMKQSLKIYSERFDRYLKKNGASFIDLNSVTELQQPGLMHDSRHFSKGAPRSLNVASLLAEIKKGDFFPKK